MTWSIPTVDLSAEIHRQIVIDRVEGQYLGQPDTLLLEDGRTILVGYPLGHGGPDTALKRSTDGGLTWSERLPVPANFAGKHNAPSIHRLIDPQGAKRLLIFVSYPRMIQSISEDDGHTWTPFEPVFPDSMSGQPGFKGHAPPKSVLPIADGRYLAMYHDHFDDQGEYIVAPMQILSADGGLTWTAPGRLGHHPCFPGAQPCEPGLVRSPDDSQILCLLRENSRQYHSLKMLSDDEGETWSEIEELPAVLTGDRHIARYAPDGRLLVTFRDMAPDSPTYGDFVGWVGTYRDLLEGKNGQCRLRLLANKGRPGDTGYAGLEHLPDGTFVSTTYCTLEEGQQPLVVSVRFTMEDIDARS